jgi:hypothetical protein
MARERRILLTFDKDFGELAKASALPSECGIVLVPYSHAAPECGRIATRKRDHVAERLGWSLLGG